MIHGKCRHSTGARLEAGIPTGSPMCAFASCVVLAAALALPGFAVAAGGGDPARGRALYESRCDSCHAESVHGRAKRVARDVESIRTWVRRWSDNLGLKWTDEEIVDVSAWLNARYYRFACPPPACPQTGHWRPPAQALASR